MLSFAARWFRFSPLKIALSISSLPWPCHHELHTFHSSHASIISLPFIHLSFLPSFLLFYVQLFSFIHSSVYSNFLGSLVYLIIGYSFVIYECYLNNKINNCFLIDISVFAINNCFKSPNMCHKANDLGVFDN